MGDMSSVTKVICDFTLYTLEAHTKAQSIILEGEIIFAPCSLIALCVFSATLLMSSSLVLRVAAFVIQNIAAYVLSCIYLGTKETNRNLAQSITESVPNVTEQVESLSEEMKDLFSSVKSILGLSSDVTVNDVKDNITAYSKLLQEKASELHQTTEQVIKDQESLERVGMQLVGVLSEVNSQTLEALYKPYELWVKSKEGSRDCNDTDLVKEYTASR